MSHSGPTTALTSGAPSFPHVTLANGESTVDIGGTPFRVHTVTTGSETLVAGESIAQINRVGSALVTPEIIFGLALLVVMFAGSLVIGLKASAPLELVRRRQAEFTADASHELRTPLSVIEAEVDLALRRHDGEEEYRAVLQRVAGEGRRLRRIVDDLLWLARVDDRGMEVGTGTTVDVREMARTCTDRFQALAATRGVDLGFTTVRTDRSCSRNLIGSTGSSVFWLTTRASTPATTGGLRCESARRATGSSSRSTTMGRDPRRSAGADYGPLSPRG